MVDKSRSVGVVEADAFTSIGWILMSWVIMVAIQVVAIEMGQGINEIRCECLPRVQRKVSIMH